MKYTFEFDGIDCGHCAQKIEQALQDHASFKDARIHFVMKKGEVHTYEVMTQASVCEMIEKVVRKLEDNVKIYMIEEKPCGCGEHQVGGCAQHNHEQEEDDCGCAACGVELSPTAAKEKQIHGVKSIWPRFIASTALLVLGTATGFPALTIIAYLIIGYDVLLRAVRNIRKGKVFDEHFLMAIATIAALIIGEYAEAVAVMLFYQVGEYFQKRAVAKSRHAIASLMDIKPERARVKRASDWLEVTPEQVQVGEVVQVRPGEKIPLDGVVLKGVTTVDTSMLTGESLPETIEVGSKVLSASINLESMIEMEVTHTLQESTVSKVLEMIEHASGRKTKAENFITKFAAWYTPLVVVLAILVASVPPLLFGGVWEEWVYRSIVFLVISCPCALVVSVPLSFFGGIGAASKHGILIKGSNYLEALSHVDVVILDKTGTITKGSFEVTQVIPHGDVTKEELIQLAVHIESHSNHPIAKAIVKAGGHGHDENVQELVEYKEEPGYGIYAMSEGKTVLAGNQKLMVRENIKYSEMTALGTWVYIAQDGQYMGAIGVSDVIKSDTAQAIQQMKARGIKEVIMLTGDKCEIAEAIGREVGVDKVYAELLPQHKVEHVEALLDRGSKVAFVGDGINDAPALTMAHVGIAMGGIGSDAAVEASDMVIMTDSLTKVGSAMSIAKMTRRIVLQNITLALGIKVIVMLLGVVGIANMWLAIFSDVGVSVLAILNAIRILGMKEKL